MGDTLPSAKRIIHVDGANAAQGTDACEIQAYQRETITMIYKGLLNIYK